MSDPKNVDQEIRRVLSEVASRHLFLSEITEEMVAIVQKNVDEVVDRLRSVGEIPEKLLKVEVHKDPSSSARLILVPLIRLDHIEVEFLWEPRTKDSK